MGELSAAGVARLAAANGDDSIVTTQGADGLSLVDRAQSATDGEEVEARRAIYGGNHLVHGYLTPFITALGADGDAWAATVPTGDLTPEQVEQSGFTALVLVESRLSTRASASWVGAYRAMASSRIAAIHAVPGAPTAWYGSPIIFEASWQAALDRGYASGDAAFAAHASDGPDVAVGEAIQAVLIANADTFATITASTVEAAGVITDME